MGEAKRRKQTDPNYGKQKLNSSPDLTKPRKWLIHSYNNFTKTYLISSPDEETFVITCLYCKSKLKENHCYLGFKDVLNKELIVIKEIMEELE